MTFKKYPKIYQIGHKETEGIFENPEDEIILQEKLDGGNFRLMFKDGKMIVGSRTQELNPDSENKYQKNFERCISYVNDVINCFNPKEYLMKTFEGLIFYGENMVKHTMEYDWQKIPPFLGFDIYSLSEERFLDYYESKKIFEQLGFYMVPLIDICKSKDITKIDEEMIPISKYASPSSKDPKAEGIMFKNYNKQIFAKIVREKFKEENREVFGGSKKHAKTDEEYFVLKFCTNSRIDKIIFKKLDEGFELDMKLMGYLVNDVYRDIWEENWEEIIFSKKTLNLKEFKKLISKRCLNVLQQMIQNNSINQSLQEIKQNGEDENERKTK